MTGAGLRIFFVSLLSVILLGCGYNPEDPAYDTARNPDNFPPSAIALLEQIDEGKLADFDAITASFGELYTGHSELLDDPGWKRIIERLGSKFQFRAVRLRRQGIGSYTRAAGYYQLASFAQPEAKQLARQAAMFSAWLKAARNPSIDLTPILDSSRADLEFLIPVIRHFMLTDTLHRAFFAKYLFKPLTSRLNAAEQLTESVFDRLSGADKALMTLAGFYSEEVDERVAGFEDSSGGAVVDLAAYRIERLDSHRFAAELYWVPAVEIGVDYIVRLQVSAADSVNPESSRSAGHTTITLEPQPATSTWKPGELAAVAGEFEFTTKPSLITVGLSDGRTDSARFLTPVDYDGNFVPLSISALTGN
jgi:hypothetical protein